MHVVIAGGHGKIALRLERLLAARGDSVAGLIRNPAQAADLEAVGARPVVCDLEASSRRRVSDHVRGADAVVFAAGAGPASGSARKQTVDRNAAAVLADAAELVGVRRYLMISTMGLERAGEAGTDAEFSTYLRAKAAAEDDLRSRVLDWTILRPGPLTDAPGTGLVRLGTPPVPPGPVPRDDVALALLVLLDKPASAGRTFELTSGTRPVAEAVHAALAGV